MEHAQVDEEHPWAHWAIAAIELCPLLGFLVTLIEVLASYFFSSDWLFRGNQWGAAGPVNTTTVREIQSRLSYAGVPGIGFNPQGNLQPNENHTGGTCSAMVLDLAARIVAFKNRISQMDGNRALSLWHHIVSLAPHFTASSAEWRAVQAAYNTIEIIKQNRAIDYSMNKIQALAINYNLNVTGSSNELDIRTNSEEDFRRTIDSIPEGVFLIRQLEPANNHKLEISGHSLLYIRLFGLTIFYDPNYGAINLTHLDQTKLLLNNFRINLNRFNVSHVRFYQLES